MIQFQETTGQMTEQAELILWDPSSYRRGPKNYKCSRLAFKSQTY